MEEITTWMDELRNDIDKLSKEVEKVRGEQEERRSILTDLESKVQILRTLITQDSSIEANLEMDLVSKRSLLENLSLRFDKEDEEPLPEEPIENEEEPIEEPIEDPIEEPVDEPLEDDIVEEEPDTIIN